MITMDYPTMGVIITGMISVIGLIYKFFPGKSMDGRTAKILEEMKNVHISQQDLLQKMNTEISLMRDTVNRSHKKLDDVNIGVKVLTDRAH